MRRKSDEIDHRPSCGLIYSDGTIRRHYFDLSHEVIEKTTQKTDAVADLDVEEFVKTLTELECDPLDFESQFRRIAANESDSLVGKELRELLDEHF